METNTHNFDDLLREALCRREQQQPQLSADFTERLMQRIASEQQPQPSLGQRGWRRWLAVAAVIAVAFLIGVAIADRTLVGLPPPPQMVHRPDSLPVRHSDWQPVTFFQVLHDTIYIDRTIARNHTVVQRETIYIQLPGPDLNPAAVHLDESFLQMEDMERKMRDFMTESGDTLMT